MSSGFPTWINGTLHPGGEGVVSTDDQGFLLGLSLFDTLYFDGERVHFAAAHMERLRNGAGALGIPWPPPHDVEGALGDYVARLEARELAVRITLSRGVPGRGATLVIGAREIVRPEDPGAVLWVSPELKRAGDPIDSVKSTNRLRYVLAREEAVRQGAFEALIATEDGFVAEGTASNLFALQDGRIVTPPVAAGCLPGVIRAVLLEDLTARPLEVGGERIPAAEARVRTSDLGRADEVFLTNSTGRILPVTGLVGDPTRWPGSAGRLFQAVLRRMERIEASERDREAPEE